VFGHVIPAAYRRPATGFVDEAWHLAYGPFGAAVQPFYAVKHVFTAEANPPPVNLTPVRIFAPGNPVARLAVESNHARRAGGSNLNNLVQIGAGTFEFFLPGPDRWNPGGITWRDQLPSGEPDPWEYWTTLPDLQDGTEIIMVKVSNVSPDQPPNNVFAAYHSLSGGQPPG
jgi:hypothetical protein